MADIAISGDEFVARQQPDKTPETRYEQGVMISMVDEHGLLVSRPTLIRKGLNYDEIMHELSEIYTQWDYRQGQYY